MSGYQRSNDDADENTYTLIGLHLQRPRRIDLHSGYVHVRTSQGGAESDRRAAVHEKHSPKRVDSLPLFYLVSWLVQGEVDLIDETRESRRGLCRPDLVQTACHGEGNRGICFVTPGEEVTNTKEVIGEKNLRLDDLQSSMGRRGGNRMAQLSGDARS